MRLVHCITSVLLCLVVITTPGQATDLNRAPDVPESPSAVTDDWSLTFEDDFDGDELDLTKWSYLPAGAWKTGYRSNDAVSLDGQGYLVIEISERDGKHYFGAITTKDTFRQAYGYYEIRAQLPKEEGLWAAFWLMTDGVHRVGNEGRDGTEIDIFESPFPKEDRISHALHWDGYEEHHKTASYMPFIPGIYDGFHTFGLEWNEDEYIFYVDGQETWRTSAGGVSEVPSWVQVSATTGNWAGDIQNATLPAQYIVDYVRVYERIHKIEIDWPTRGSTVAPNEPIRFTVIPDIDVAEVRVTQNDIEIYKGPEVPTDLRLSLPLLEAKEDHKLTVTVTDRNGQLWERSVRFEVKRLALKVPDVGQNRVRGTLHLEAASGFGPDENVIWTEVSLHSIRALEQIDRIVLYEAVGLPNQLALDTLSLSDGAYDIKLTVNTDAGRTASDTHRIVVDNWDVLTEDFDPPTVFFGVEFDSLKTSERSSGWRHMADTPQAFFGDQGRLASGGDNDEYLVWRQPRLRKYSLIIYAQTDSVGDVLEISVSDDGEQWHTLNYTVEVIGQSEEGWSKLQVVGEVDTERAQNYFRIMLISDGLQENEVQLGNLELGGLLGE